MKNFVGHIINKVIKSTSRSNKVSPTIKSVKPFTDKKFSKFGFDKAKTIADRANIVRRRTSIKRMDEVDNLQKKRKEGIKASKDLKKMVDTGKAEKIGGVVFHKSIPEKKATGGRVGRRFGSPKPKTNIQKIKETFGPKKKVPSKFKGFSKLPENVQQKIDAKLAKKV